MGKVQFIAQAAKECAHLKDTADKKEKTWCEGYLRQCNKPDPALTKEEGVDIFLLKTKSGREFDYDTRADCRNRAARAASKWGAPVKGNGASSPVGVGAPGGASGIGEASFEKGMKDFGKIIGIQMMGEPNRQEKMFTFRARFDDGTATQFQFPSAEIYGKYREIKKKIRKLEGQEAEIKKLDVEFLNFAMKTINKQNGF